ncbi:acyl-CoA dehydrogenase family protein [Pseudonocardia thermophila]|uniref:acyl-CoA dehydrogenase family protein n=1 Tax=Pseudonocardia thermophila TaxID=1848 RepID=UPI00248DDEA8|nr:acyl-CoA dehydrogenase family protein [Pseudonocardia thermophila]
MSKDVFVFSGLTDEQRAVADLAAEVLSGAVSDVTAGADVGWFGIGVPEALGGSGASLAELAPVVECCGATGAASAAVWTAGIVQQLLLAAATPPREIIAALAECAATVALPLTDPESLTRDTGERIRCLAFGAADSDWLVFPVVNGTVLRLAMLPSGHPARRSEDVLAVDRSRPYSRHEIEIAAVRPHDMLDVPGLLGLWRRRKAVVLALDAVGAAGAALSKTVEYSRNRHQFGRPIGSFQAYKHRCSDARLRLLLAQSIAYRAASDPEDDMTCVAAAVEAGPAAVFVCGEAVQLHGGIGFTWEAGIGAHLKRARADEIGLDLGSAPSSVLGVSGPAAGVR